MDIKQKLRIVEQAIKSISTHDDADSVVILAALDRVGKIAGDESGDVRARQAALASEALTG